MPQDVLMTKSTEKTGNRKCWHVLLDGQIIESRLTLAGADRVMAHESMLRPNTARLDYCRDGYKLIPCDGHAHSNAHIDNCGRCAPRWGWLMVPADCGRPAGWALCDDINCATHGVNCGEERPGHPGYMHYCSQACNDAGEHVITSAK
jgi:hypothetical protein